MILPPSHYNECLAAWQAAECEPVFVSDNPQIWRMLTAARQRGTVEFRYWDGSMLGKTRWVTPAAVFIVAGSTGFYTEADCLLRAEQRVFRLDHVEWPME